MADVSKTTIPQSLGIQMNRVREIGMSLFSRPKAFVTPGLDWQLQGMALAFDPLADQSIHGTIQFEDTANRGAIYQLHLDGGTCIFHRGTPFSPDLTVRTPPGVWWEISTGKLSGQQAFLEGQYTAQGDLQLLRQLNRLFRSREDLDLRAPAGQRPPGPLPLPGMAWMQIALLPWIMHWILFGLSPASGMNLVIPLFLSLMIIGYRLKYGGLTWLEWCGVIFFGLASAQWLLPWNAWPVWGSVVSGLALSVCWLGSLLVAGEPLSAAYSKWTYTRKLWGTDLFNYPNAVISLMWGLQFLMASCLGIAVVLIPEHGGFLSLARFGLLLPAILLTLVWQKKAPDWPVADYPHAFARLRRIAVLGLACCVAVFLNLLQL